MSVADLTDIVVRAPFDMRPETLARELIDSGLAAQVDVVPSDAFKRPYSREISSLDEDLPTSVRAERVFRITAVREGLADTLPPGLFYRPTGNRDRSEAVMLEDAELQAATFMEAQRFFQPFDMETGRLRIALEIFENESATDMFSTFSNELFETIWPDLDLEVDASEKSALLSLIFRAGHIAGDLSQCRLEIEHLLGVPTKILRAKTSTPYSISHVAPLGESVLGVNYVPFEILFDTDHLTIEVGPVDDSSLPLFRYHEPVGKGYKLLKFLCDLLLPVEMSWQIAVVPSTQTFRIGKKTEIGILSYSTILG